MEKFKFTALVVLLCVCIACSNQPKQQINLPISHQLSQSGQTTISEVEDTSHFVIESEEMQWHTNKSEKEKRLPLNRYSEAYLFRLRRPPLASVMVGSDYVFFISEKATGWEIDFSVEIILMSSWDRRCQYRLKDLDTVYTPVANSEPFDAKIGAIYPRQLQLNRDYRDLFKQKIIDSLFWSTTVPKDTERLNRDYWAWEMRGYKNGAYKRICDVGDPTTENLIRPFLLKIAKTANLKDTGALRALEPKNLYKGEKYRNFGL